ncbi:MAG TPA: hypothetical protein VNI78_02585, partial [Vicinamibacterales bacterium]|nr:hypothetical protein [Vicinamibacterales bacterium]
IYNWDRRKVTINAKWVDVVWQFPGPAAARAGSQHVFTTKLSRYTTKEPLANYRVRYRIVGGPPAVLLPSQTQEAVVVSDLGGNAQVAIAQPAPVVGVNQVEIEVIRPPDPTAPSGTGLVLAKAFTTIEWLAPKVELNIVGPATAAVGAEVPYTITVVNNGKIESQTMTVTNAVPEGLQFVRSDPPATSVGKDLIWTLRPLGPAQAHTIQAIYRTLRPGTVQNCAAVVTEEGQKDEKCVTTQVTEPRLDVKLTGPDTAVVGVPITIDVAVSNPGTGPATNVTVSARLSDGLEAQGLEPGRENSRVINTREPLTLAPLETKIIPLAIVPRKEGPQRIDVTVTAAGGLKATAAKAFTVAAPRVALTMKGPLKRYPGKLAEWNIRVTNPGSVPLNNVTLRDRLPPELIFESASGGGVLKNGEVVWDLGTIPPGREAVVQLVTRVGNTPSVVTHTAVVTTEFGLREESSAVLEIVGVGALTLEAVDIGDPVEIGKTVVYEIEVKNPGSAPVKNVQVTAMLPAELKPVNFQGPGVAGKLIGQSVVFDALTLEANQTVKYQVRAEGRKAGDVRFQARLTADILTTPLTELESTTIVDPNALPKVAPPVVTPNTTGVSRPGGGRMQPAESPNSVPLLPPPPAPPKKQ